MCKFLPFCRRLSVGLSAYSVAALSIQYYRVNSKSLPRTVRVSSQTTWPSTVATICGVWIVVVLFAIPTAFAWTAYFEGILYDCKSYYKIVIIFELSSFVCTYRTCDCFRFTLWQLAILLGALYLCLITHSTRKRKHIKILQKLCQVLLSSF